MAKIALVTDTHFGVRSDNQQIAEHQGRFWRDVFFPYIDKHNIKYVRHLGDIVDRRKFVNYLTARNLRRMFIQPCIERGLDLGVIIGNHDVFFKNTNEVNAMTELYQDTLKAGFKWWSEPHEEEIDGTKILLMPWINSGNYRECFAAMEETKAQIMMGHLEIAGFEMYRGSPSDHGFSKDLFSKFEIVMSGHFHHKSTNENINYLGSTYEMTWSDYDDPRGFHIFDTDTRELTYIQNPNRIFHKLFYNDADKVLTDILATPIDNLKDCYVKLIVLNKTNPYWFDMLVANIEKLGVIDLQVVEDHLGLDIEDIDSMIDEAEDTLTIMRKYASAYLQDKNPELAKELDALLTSLYQEALTTEEASN